MSRTDLGYTSYSSWSINKQRVPQGSLLRPLPFLYYINDLPKNFNNDVKSVLFADGSSLIVSNHNCVEYKMGINGSVLTY